jgi:hypothetical protein
VKAPGGEGDVLRASKVKKVKKGLLMVYNIAKSPRRNRDDEI